MTPTRDMSSRKSRVWMVPVVLALLMTAGCPQPPKAPEAPKPAEQPLLFRLLAGGEQKKVLDYAGSFLGNLEVKLDPTLQSRESSDTVLPDYKHAVNTVLLPQDRSGDAFLRAAADALGISLSEVRAMLPKDERGTQLVRFIRNVFLFHELAAYLRNQYKVFNYVNHFKEEEIGHEFARVVIDHFVSVEPTLKPLRDGFVTFYEKLLARAAQDFPGVSQDETSLRNWFNKNHADLVSMNLNSYLLFKMIRQLASFKKQQEYPLTGFMKKYLFEDRAKLNITLSDKSLSAYTLYRGKSQAIRRIAHSYQFRGLSGVAAGPDGRLFFSDYRNIQQVTDRGSRDIVEGSQGVFAPTGFCIDAQGKLWFVDRDTVRAVDFPSRRVANVKLSGRLKGSASADPHGIIPIALTADGSILIVNNSTSPPTLYMLDSSGSVADSAALRGTAGGIACYQGSIYVTNTSHHTVDRVEFGSGVSTIAGMRDYPGHGDGKGFEVFFNSPAGICVDGDGTVFVADTCNHAVRRIDADGRVSTVIGIERGRSDGPVESAQLHCPVSVAVGKDGVIYVAELASERVVAIAGKKPQPESKRIPATDVSGLDSPDRETAQLSKSIERCAIGYRLLDTYVRRGIRYRDLEEYDKSWADLQAAIGIAPDKLLAYVEAGITKEAAGEANDAIDAYTLAIDMKKDLVPIERFRDQDFLRALMHRGLAHASQGTFAPAIEDLTKVIETRKMAVEVFKEPDLPQERLAQIWFTRGRIYLDSGDFKKAVADFDQALVLNQKMVKAYYHRGLAYKSAGKYDSAVKDLRKAASLDSSYADPHYTLGQIYQSNIVDNEKAIQHLRTYLALKGSHKTDAQARIEELKKKLTRTTTSDEPFWEEVIEDAEGRRWILRHYASGKTQKFPVKEDNEK